MGAFAGPLLGRSAELSSIDAALDELRERRSCALAIVGEPGIGKTRLLSERPHPPPVVELGRAAAASRGVARIALSLADHA